MEIFLTLLSGIGWIIVYEECIRLGIKQKTYAMPIWALALNIILEPHKNLKSFKGFYSAVKRVEVLHKTGKCAFWRIFAMRGMASLIKAFNQRIVLK